MATVGLSQTKKLRHYKLNRDLCCCANGTKVSLEKSPNNLRRSRLEFSIILFFSSFQTIPQRRYTLAQLTLLYAAFSMAIQNYIEIIIRLYLAIFHKLQAVIIVSGAHSELLNMISSYGL